MRVVLTGQKRFGADVLRLLMERDDEVLGVSCPKADAEGKADKLWIAAQNAGLPLIANGKLTQYTMPEGADLIVAAHSHDFVGSVTRRKARLGAIGFHPSMLPRHRGRSSIEWAVRFGEKVTGGTIYWLDDVVDGGPIAAQEHCMIRPDDTALSLWVRELAPMGVRLFRQVLRDLDRGIVIALDQDKELATWEPAIDGVPRLFRPDLPMLGGPADFVVIKDREELHRRRERSA